MTLEDVKKIIKLFETSNMTFMDLEFDSLKLKLEKKEGNTCNSITDDLPITEENNNLGNVVKSPLVGCYHSAPYIDGKPFVVEGQKVKKGDKLCIIEAMKVMNEITSPYDGIIMKIYSSDGDMIEYDKPLFLVGEDNV